MEGTMARNQADRSVNSVHRLVKYMWPYRFAFAGSVMCAVGIAALWCANIATFGPIMEVLFKNDSLQAYVDREMETAQTAISEDKQFLEGEGISFEQRSRVQARIAENLSRLNSYATLNRWVMPWVPTDKFQTLALLVGLLFCGTLIKAIFIYLQELLVGRVVNGSANDLRRDCFMSAQQLDLQSAAREGTANLTSRMTNDIHQVMIAVSVFGTKVIREPLKAFACIGAAWYINWRLTLTAVLFVPLIGVLLGRFGRRMKKAANSAMDSVAVIYDCISETFDSFRIVTAFGGQKRQSEQFSKANEEYYDRVMKTIRLNALIRPTSEVMAVLIVCIAFTPGAYMVLKHSDTFMGIQLAKEPMTIMQLLMFYVMLAGTLDPVRKMSSVFGQIKQGMAGADRAFELIDARSLISEPEEPRRFRRHRELIRFEDLSFRYASFDEDKAPVILQNASLDVPFGEVVAIVGTNGSGKSTLLSLLPRFMDPDDGRILIDGVDIREYSTGDLRSQMGLVSQETMLFDDSIFENIRYGSFEADEVAVKEAAVKAHAWDFIQSLPDGMKTEIGPGGRKLSGGQRQRIALARAILRDPSILILDEATSAVDAESEDLIHKVLMDFRKDRTVFIITHVLNETFLDLIDRVVVMDRGQIAAMGSHDQLLQSCDIYRRLYQSGNASRAAA